MREPPSLSPYVRLQLFDAALAGVLAALAWWGSSAVMGRPRWLTPRLALILIVIVPLAFFGFRLVIQVLGWRSYRGFFVIALSFYSGVLWIPLFALISVARARPRPRDAPLAVALALLAPAVGAWALFVEPNRLQVREERIEVESWPAGERPLRIVHLSDLQTVGSCARERRALELVRALEPDLIVVTGDYITGPFDVLGGASGPAYDAARAFLSGLSAPYGVVVVAGHSEQEHQREVLFAGLDLIYLTNAQHEIELTDGRQLAILGLAPWDPRFDALQREKQPDELRIVVSHVPDVTRHLDGRDVDLHLAGHTHGGQVVVPGFGPLITLSRLPRRYARGLFRFGDHWLNVCAGLGMEGSHAPRMRLFCPPEICLIEVDGAR